MNTSFYHETVLSVPTVEMLWKQIFDKYDERQNDKVPLSKLYDILQTGNPDKIPGHAVQKILKEFSINKTGYLNFSQFMNLLDHEKENRNWMNTYIHHTIPQRKRHMVSYNGQYENSYSCSPPPMAIIIISVVQVVMFLCHSYVGSIIPLCVFEPSKRSQAWRFITYMFVHNGVNHLLINLLIQVLLGIPLEMVHGWYRILFIYFNGVIAGSLFSSVLQPTICLGGASAGVYAISTAHLANILMNWSEMEFGCIQLFVFILLAAVDITNYIIERFFQGNRTMISHVAHLAGAAAGLFIGLRVLRNLREYYWEKVVFRLALLVYATFVAAAILWHIFAPESYYKDGYCLK